MEAKNEDPLREEPLEPDVILQLIFRHLVHHCYEKTARALLSSVSVPTKLSLDFIPYRRDIVQCISRGEIETAISRLNSSFPQLLNENPDIRFSLYSQKFVELIRAKNVKDALAYAQQELASFGLKDSKYLEPLQDVLALLAYEDAEKSPVGDLMSEQRRAEVANNVNTAILDAQSGSASELSALEPLLKQLTVVQNQLLPEKKRGSWNIAEYLLQFDPPLPLPSHNVSSPSFSHTTTPSGKRKAEQSLEDKSGCEDSAQEQMSMEIVSGSEHPT